MSDLPDFELDFHLRGGRVAERAAEKVMTQHEDDAMASIREVREHLAQVDVYLKRAAEQRKEAEETLDRVLRRLRGYYGSCL